MLMLSPFFPPSGDKPTAAAPPFVFVAPVRQDMTTNATSSQAGVQQGDKTSLGVSDITFVSESQPQSNSSRQRKKPRRKKAPIYWGKRPSRRKADVKRKLDSELDSLTGEKECLENGEQAESDPEDIPGNSGGDRSCDEETEEVLNVHVNCDKENDATDHQDDDDDDVELMENGDTSINGEVVLLDSESLAGEVKDDDLDPKSVLQNESGLVSQLSERTLKNHVLSIEISSLPNGITTGGCAKEKECDVQHIGEHSSNRISSDHDGNLLSVLYIAHSFACLLKLVI